MCVGVAKAAVAGLSLYIVAGERAEQTGARVRPYVPAIVTLLHYVYNVIVEQIQFVLIARCVRVEGTATYGTWWWPRSGALQFAGQLT